MKQLQARAVVTLTVHVDLTQPWPEDATVKQVWDQGAKDARLAVDGALMHLNGMRVVQIDVKRVDAIVGHSDG